MEPVRHYLSKWFRQFLFGGSHIEFIGNFPRRLTGVPQSADHFIEQACNRYYLSVFSSLGIFYKKIHKLALEKLDPFRVVDCVDQEILDAIYEIYKEINLKTGGQAGDSFTGIKVAGND